MKYEKKLVTRLILALAILIMPSSIFHSILLKPTIIFSYLPLLIKYSASVVNDSIIINSQVIKFIPACTAVSAYLLLALLILLTKDIKLKTAIYIGVIGSMLILMANAIRIDFLIMLLIEANKNLFTSLHLFFWKILSSVYVAFIWILLVSKFKIKNIPIYSDVKFLIKNIK